MKLQVVTVANWIPENHPYYKFREFKASLAKFGVEPVVLGLGQEWMGLMTKPYRVREWLRSGGCTADRLIYTDAFDVVFQKSPEEINAWCHAVHGDALVFNTEKACWPLAELAENFPDTGSPWRYLNGGLMCGPTERVRAVMEDMDIDAIGFDRPGVNPNDQVPYLQMYVAGRHGMVVDPTCTMAQCLSASTLDEFDFSGSLIRNRITGSTPGAFHCNGGSKEVFQSALFAHLGL